MTTQMEMSLDNVQWRNQVQPIVIQRLRGKEFTADDIHSVVPTEPPHHNAYGSLIKCMARKKLIELVGHRKSERPERNGGLQRVWRIIG